MEDLPTGTRQKALAFNLDKAKYGTFAEIGAGQEVARWFDFADTIKSKRLFEVKVSSG